MRNVNELEKEEEPINGNLNLMLGIDIDLVSSLELLECNDSIDPHPPNLSFAHP